MQKEDMQDTRIPARLGSRIINRDDIKVLLQNYDADRKSIALLTDQLASEADDLLWQSGSAQDDVRVQTQTDVNLVLEQILKRCDQRRRYFRKTAESLMRATVTLDRLIYSVSKLQPVQRLVIIRIYKEEKSVPSVAKEINKAERTVKDYLSKAVDQVWEDMNVS